MPIFGLTNGMIPIVAFNYGARDKKRISETLKLSAIIAVSIMTIGTILFQAIPDTLLHFFDASEHMLEIGIPALRIISISFPMAGFAIVCSSMFQALGNGMYSLWTSVARQMVVILPVAYLFAKTLGLHSVWLSFPIAELVCLLMSILLLRRIYRLKVSKI